MPIERSKELVNKVVTDNGTQDAQTGRAVTPLALHILLPEVQIRMQQPGAVFLDCVDTCKNSQGHGTGYTDQNHELRMWHVGLMFAEYVAGLIADKAEKGHCQAEGRTHPCPLGRKLHLDMLARFKHDLLTLISEIEALEDDEKNWQEAKSHL